MIIRSSLAVDERYNCYEIVNQIDQEALNKAKEIFQRYKSKGIIINESFSDDTWKIYNEESITGLSFRISEIQYEKNGKNWIGCSCSVYKDAVKAYATYLLGTITTTILQDVVHLCIKLPGLKEPEKVLYHSAGVHLMNMLRMLPSNTEELEDFIEKLDQRVMGTVKPGGKQRKLVDFQSYMRFDELLDSYWKKADRDHKLFHFPIYLWWKLTSILPLRPKEYILLPSECLFYENGRYYIKIRRTKKKKGYRELGYRIDKDYKIQTYPVNVEIAECISWYQKETQNMKHSDIDSLFKVEPHYKREGVERYQDRSKLYSYEMLCKCLSLFYKNVVADRKDIARVHLGDTRHIAMMNLIISGGSPVVCKIMADHEDINISSHYYSDFSTLVECRVYEEYRRIHSDKSYRMKGSDVYVLPKPECETKVSGGWCQSEKYARHMIDDCVASVNECGEIGDCSNCQYFRPEAGGISLNFFDVEEGKEKVDSDSWFLRKMIEIFRKGIGNETDIQKAILRLQQSCNHYQECLVKAMM